MLLIFYIGRVCVMITDGFTYIAVLIFFSSLIVMLEKSTDWAIFRIVPAAVFIYFVSMLLTTLDLWNMAATKSIYRDLSSVLTHAMIFMMLLRCDIRKLFRLGPRMLIGFFSATFSIMISFSITFLIMKDHLGSNAWMTLAALSGSWIGGYDNIAEIQVALSVPEIDMGYAFIMDSINYSLWIMLLLWFVTLAPRFNHWTKANTADLEVVSRQMEEYDARRVGDMPFSNIFLLLGTSLFVVAVGVNIGTLLQTLFPIFTKSIWTILFISIFALIAAFSPLGRLAGSLELANVMLYSLIAIIASRTSFWEISDAPLWVLTGFIILGIHAILMLLIARILKLDMFTLCISSVANIGGATSAPLVASLYSGALIPVGVFAAIIGHVVGTSLGMWLARFLEMLL